MRKRAGRRIQLKRLQAQYSNSIDPNFLLPSEVTDHHPAGPVVVDDQPFEGVVRVIETTTDSDLPIIRGFPENSLREISLSPPSYPPYQSIKRGDPRRYVYAIRNLFGDTNPVELPTNYPIPKPRFVDLTKSALIIDARRTPIPGYIAETH